MRADQLSRIDAAYDKGLWQTLAGDYITYVDALGKQYPKILCIISNLKFEHKVGLIVDEAGLREQEILEVLFSKKVLASAGVTLDVAGYWLLNGIKYDFADKMWIETHLNPIGGLNNLISVRIREAAEVNQTQVGSQFSYDLS